MFERRCVKNNQSLYQNRNQTSEEPEGNLSFPFDKRLALKSSRRWSERCDATKRNKSRIYPPSLIYLGFIKIAQNQQNGATTTMVGPVPGNGR